jgi:hypothetical protein
MIKKHLLLLCLIIAITIIFTGCKDIQDSFKPGSFGETPEEQAMVDALTEKHGNLTETGEPRFLEAMMTSHVDNFIPVDVVSKYSQNAEELYLWFVYDNFNEDILDIEWVYLDTDHSIHTFQSQTGEDFGRGTFILEQPDDGWPIGNYKVSIRGRGVEETLLFEIIDGPTVAEALPFEDGKITLPGSTGWHFVGWDEFINHIDLSVAGEPSGGNMTGTSSKLYDYLEYTGGKNDFTHNIKRTNEAGKTLHDGLFHVTWTDPPIYLVPGEKASFTVNRKTEGWGISNMAITFDMGHLEPGYGTSSSFPFITSQGEKNFSDYQGLVESEKVIPEGKEGDQRAVLLSLGNGYGYRYVYEWRE